MLIKIKQDRRIGFNIPITFVVLEDLIEAFEDWIWAFERLFPKWNKKLISWGEGSMVYNMPGQNFSLGLIFKIIHELFYELRKHGRWKVVEVDTKDVYVTVEFF